MNNEKRTIMGAMYPIRIDGDFNVVLKVWFEELDEPIEFLASPLDCTVHGKELWIRAMAGEYGQVQVRSIESLIGHQSVETLFLENHDANCQS